MRGVIDIIGRDEEFLKELIHNLIIDYRTIITDLNSMYGTKKKFYYIRIVEKHIEKMIGNLSLAGTHASIGQKVRNKTEELIKRLVDLKDNKLNRYIQNMNFKGFAIEFKDAITSLIGDLNGLYHDLKMLDTFLKEKFGYSSYHYLL